MTQSTACRRLEAPAYSCEPLLPSKHVPTLHEDARLGLLRRPRSLPAKYFYDARGSELFDRICDTPEYYPTRVESILLERNAGAIISVTQPDTIVELGSGTSRKTRHLFNACEVEQCYPGYWPMDVCESMLQETAIALGTEYPWLNIDALVGDYHGGFGNFNFPGQSTLYVFLGGTIGNFEKQAAVNLLAGIRSLMKKNDYLLLGFDRVKEVSALEAAYNDQQGITAEFNLNLLRVLNKNLDADFVPEAFTHHAIYNKTEQQIEMYLVAQSEQQITLRELDETIRLEPGEKILTEISRKFTSDSISHLIKSAGLNMVEHWQADQGVYSLVLAKADCSVA